MSFTFNYNTFYDYYTNPKNLLKKETNNPIDIHYYKYVNTPSQNYNYTII